MVKSLLQCRRPGFDPWVGTIHWRRKWQPTLVLLLWKSHGWRSLAGYSPQGRKESDTTEWLHFHFSIHKMKSTSCVFEYLCCITLYLMSDDACLIVSYLHLSVARYLMDFPGGTNGKEPTCQGGRCNRCGFDPRVRKIPWRRSWQSIPVFLAGESHEQRCLGGCSP